MQVAIYSPQKCGEYTDYSPHDFQHQEDRDTGKPQRRRAILSVNEESACALASTT